VPDSVKKAGIRRQTNRRAVTFPVALGARLASSAKENFVCRYCTAATGGSTWHIDRSSDT
jgi:hypothetical protein